MAEFNANVSKIKDDWVYIHVYGTSNFRVKKDVIDFDPEETHWLKLTLETDD